MRRRLIKSAVKDYSSTVAVPLILVNLSIVEVFGIYSVAVKCIDTIRNTDSVGRILSNN